MYLSLGIEMVSKLSSILFLTASMSVAACSASGDGEGDYKPNVEVEQRIAAVKAMLKDPDSARFTNLSLKEEVLGNKGASGTLSTSGNMDLIKDLTLCGEVNAKNSVGGYTGPRPFAASTDRTLIYQDAEKPDSPPISSGSEAMVGWLEEQEVGRQAMFNNQAISDACGSPGKAVIRPDDVN